MVRDANPKVAMDRDGKPGSGVTTNRRKFLATTAAGAGITALAGCTGGGDDTIKIGAPYLLSGVAESFGASSRAGAELAAEEINDDGGIDGQDVELIFRDHEGSDAARVIRSLVQEDNVDALIGLTSSGVAVATAPLIEQLQVPMILTDIGTSFVTEHDSDTYGDDAVGNDYVFRTNTNTAQNMYGMVQNVAENMDGIETVAGMGPDYAYGHQVWDYFKAMADGHDGLDLEYLDDATTFTELGSTDMSAQISSVLSEEPDLLVTGYWADDITTFVQQSTSQGIEDSVEHVITSLGSDILQFNSLGETMPDGWNWHGWYWHDALDTEANADFVDRYEEAHGELPAMQPPSSYEAITVYRQVMESVGTNSEDIIGELEGLTYEGPRGEVTIDADSHQAKAPAVGGVSEYSEDLGRAELNPVNVYEPDHEEIRSLLEGSDLPPGV